MSRAIFKPLIFKCIGVLCGVFGRGIILDKMDGKVYVFGAFIERKLGELKDECEAEETVCIWATKSYGNRAFKTAGYADRTSGGIWIGTGKYVGIGEKGPGNWGGSG